MRVTITIDGADELLARSLERVVSTLARSSMDVQFDRKTVSPIREPSDSAPPPAAGSDGNVTRRGEVNRGPVASTPTPSGKRPARTDAQRAADRARQQKRRDRLRSIGVQTELSFASVTPVTSPVTETVTVTSERDVPPRDPPGRAPAVSESSGIDTSGESEKKTETNTLSVPSEPERVTRESDIVTDGVTGQRDGHRDIKPENMSEGRTEGLLFDLSQSTVMVDPKRVLEMFVAAHHPDRHENETIVPFLPDYPEAFAHVLERFAMLKFDESSYQTLIRCAHAGGLKPRYNGPLTLMHLLGHSNEKDPPTDRRYPARGLFTVLDMARKWERREKRMPPAKTAPTPAMAALRVTETDRAANQSRASELLKRIGRPPNSQGASR